MLTAKKLIYNKGGGLAAGSICLVSQDKHNSYSEIISRCYLAEGIYHKHAIYIADLNEDLNSLKKVIPLKNHMNKN